jgi:hypothetical protein
MSIFAWRWSRDRVLVVLAFGFAVGAGAFLWFGPVMQVARTERSLGDGATGSAMWSAASLWRTSRLAAVLVVPLLLTALPLAGRERESRALRIVSAAGLLAFVVVGAASIGLLFLPSALLMVAAAFTRTRA